MTIETGLYIVKNVRNGNFAELPDANDGTPVGAAASAYATSQKWNVVRLGNGNYSIVNQGANMYANAGSRAPVGAVVEGNRHSQQWNIQETRVRGQYTIASIDSRLYWSFIQNDDGTPITLQDGSADTRNWWTFQKTQ